MFYLFAKAWQHCYNGQVSMEYIESFEVAAEVCFGFIGQCCPDFDSNSCISWIQLETWLQYLDIILVTMEFLHKCIVIKKMGLNYEWQLIFYEKKRDGLGQVTWVQCQIVEPRKQPRLIFIRVGCQHAIFTFFKWLSNILSNIRHSVETDFSHGQRG